MNILCFAGSLRADSLNKKFVKNAHKALSQMSGVQSRYLDLAEYSLPVYNQDIETKEMPKAALDLASKVAGVQGLVISTPENNGSIAATLKNTVDWISRTPNTPFARKWVLLLGASPGALGAVRGLWHSRVPFEVLGCLVFPDMMGLPRAHEAFDANGDLKDPAVQARLTKLLSEFVHVTGLN